MKKLLFALNDNNECKRAANSLLSLFEDQKVALTLLHVTPETILHAESGLVDYEVIEKNEFEESKKILNEFEEIFKNDTRAKGFKLESLLKSGNPIDIVLEIANDYDLLVIGSSEQGILHRIFASHQNSFVNASPISVLVAK